MCTPPRATGFRVPLEAIADCPVVGIALSHMRPAHGLGVCADEAATCRRAAERLRIGFDVPVVDVLAHGTGKLAEVLCRPRHGVTATWGAHAGDAPLTAGRA